jgi:hypothetical protein
MVAREVVMVVAASISAVVCIGIGSITVIRVSGVGLNESRGAFGVAVVVRVVAVVVGVLMVLMLLLLLLAVVLNDTRL